MASPDRTNYLNFLDGWRTTLMRTAREWEALAVTLPLGTEERLLAGRRAMKLRRAAELFRDDEKGGPVLVEAGEDGAAT